MCKLKTKKKIRYTDSPNSVIDKNRIIIIIQSSDSVAFANYYCIEYGYYINSRGELYVLFRESKTLNIQFYIAYLRHLIFLALIFA